MGFLLQITMSCLCAAGACAGAVSWLRAWWRQGAGAGAGCWLCAWWRQGARRRCRCRCRVPVLVLVLGAGRARGGDRVPGRRCWVLAVHVLEPGCRCWCWCWVLAVRVVETGCRGGGAGCWLCTCWSQGAGACGGAGCWQCAWWRQRVPALGAGCSACGGDWAPVLGAGCAVLETGCRVPGAGAGCWVPGCRELACRSSVLVPASDSEVITTAPSDSEGRQTAACSSEGRPTAASDNEVQAVMGRMNLCTQHHTVLSLERSLSISAVEYLHSSDSSGSVLVDSCVKGCIVCAHTFVRIMFYPQRQVLNHTALSFYRSLLSVCAHTFARVNLYAQDHTLLLPK